MSDRHEGFAETSKEDWVLAAQKELNEDNPFQKLSYQSGDLTFLPYYSSSDLPTSRPTSDIRPGQGWINAPKVSATNATIANKAALEHLQAGATGILFEINNASISPSELLSGIELPFCSIFFYGNVTPSFLNSFAQYSSLHFKKNEVNGAAYGLTPKDLLAIEPAFSGFDHFITIGLVHEARPADVDALHQLLLALTDQFDARQGQPRLRDAAILMSVSDDFLAELIRMRALNLLWSAVCAGYQGSASMQIHGWARPFAGKEFEPHGNMISSVSRTISAVITGAAVITVDPASEDSMQSRIARNISFILQEESQLGRVANPAEGSYFIEAESMHLAEAVWAKFKASKR